MENWIITNQFILLAFILLRLLGKGPPNRAVIILFLLIYISLNMAFYIVKRPWMKQGLLWILVAVIAGCAKYLYLPLILLLPVNLFELATIYHQPLWLPLIISATPAPFLPKAIFYEYISLGALSYLICLLSWLTFRRIQALTGENDALRDQIHWLSGKLNKDMEYERQLKYSSQLEERNKIAQEIHDKIGHVISGSLIQLEAAKLLMESDPVGARSAIQKVIDILREGMENLRITLKNIKPPVEQMGINRIRLMIDEFSASHQLATSLLYHGNLERISSLHWRIIQDNIHEALTNVSKHAHATKVTVTIEVLNKIIKTEVKDNGTGGYPLQKGLGLSGMEERSSNAGGKIIVDSSQGFSIITLLPVEGE